MDSFLYLALLTLFIAVCIKKGQMQAKSIVLSSLKTVVLENNSVALTCSNTTGTLLSSNWETSLYDNERAYCFRFEDACKTSGFLKNTDLYDCICIDNGSYTVLLKHVDRYQHGSNWTCGTRHEKSNTVVINVLVPVTKAVLTLSGNVSVYENTNATFTCTPSYSLPSAQIKWYRSYSKSTVEIIDSQDVNIKRATHNREDNVICVTETLSYRVNRSVNDWSVYCTATNWQDNLVTSEKTNLSVIYPPNSPPVINGFINGSTNTVTENETVILSCSVKGGNPLAKLEWYCNFNNNKTREERINETVTSYISWIAKRTYRKTCTCRMVRVLLNVSSFVNVDILFPPGIPNIQLQHHGSETKIISSRAKLIENKSYRLLCMAESNPLSEYTWDGPQGIGISHNASVLLTNFNHTQNGTYTCHARNSMFPTEKNKSVNIAMLFKPTLANINSQDASEGSTKIITCDVISANPNDIIFQWTRDSEAFNASSKELILQNVSRFDAMNYTCTVRNNMRPTIGEDEEGYSSETFYLNVWYRACVTEFAVAGQQDVPIVKTELTNITFTCEIDSNPNSTIKIITPNSTEIISTGANVFEYNHFLSSCFDNGTYTCSGSNDYNNGHPGLAALAVFVYCTPMADPDIETDLRRKLYVPVTLRFRAIAIPDPTFTWQKWTNISWQNLTNDNVFSISSHNLQSNLTVQNFTEAAANVYRLIVDNGIGKMIQNYTLFPFYRPGTPTEFRHILELLTDTTITLLWKPGFNGGSPQTFIIMYRTVKDKDWKSTSVQETANTVMNFTIHGLSSFTRYSIQLFAVNTEGSSENVTLHIKTKETATVKDIKPESKVGLVVGSVSGVAFVALGAVIGILVYRKRYKKNTDSSYEERSYVNVTEMKTVSGGKRPVVNALLYEQLKPGTERDDKRMEQPYDTLKPEQGPAGATSQTYVNLKL